MRDDRQPRGACGVTLIGLVHTDIGGVNPEIVRNLDRDDSVGTMRRDLIEDRMVRVAGRHVAFRTKAGASLKDKVVRICDTAYMYASL